MQYRWLVAVFSVLLLLFWFWLPTESADTFVEPPASAMPDLSLVTQMTATAHGEAVGEDGSGKTQFAQTATLTPVASEANPATTLYLPFHDAPDRLQQRMRRIAIRQANALALAALPADVVHLLAELKFVEAAQLLQQLADQGYTGADRMLVSMAANKRPNVSCFPYTEIVASPVPVFDLASHERLLRNALSAVPPNLSGRLAKTEVLFDKIAVLAACSELAINLQASLERLAANAGVDDEDRLFVAPFVVNYGLTLPERAPDADGNTRPTYSRATQAGFANMLKTAWWQFNDRTEHYKRLTIAATAAEPYPELFGLAGSVLLDHRNPVTTAEHKAQGLAYLAVASERGDRLGLERYGMELMRHAESIEQGYVLSLFARHLNARGCYPGDYLAE